MKNKNQSKSLFHSNKSASGFTLIELLVVVAIIALLASVILVGMYQARQKSRDARRIADMAQMNTALEIYFNTYRGYPADDDTNGQPDNFDQFTRVLPVAPVPPDGTCSGSTHSPGSCGGANQIPCGIPANTYYYAPTGTPQTINGVKVYPGYNYLFCLGAPTGNFSAGEHVLTAQGIR